MPFEDTIEFIRSLYPQQKEISLHNAVITKDDEESVLSCLRSTYVSTTGDATTKFEEKLSQYFQPYHVVATISGTAALKIALITSGVKKGDLVITQALSFVATANAINQIGAEPVFLDINNNFLSLCPKSLQNFLKTETIKSGQDIVHSGSQKKIKAIVPMHTFGHPADMELIQEIADDWSLPIIEDAAESLGSKHNGKLTGTFGQAACLSFNGNKIITTGGGGAAIFKTEEQACRAKHLISTAKVSHPYQYFHDEVGYNYRMPSLNASLGCSQFDRLAKTIRIKRDVAQQYEKFFLGKKNVNFIRENEKNYSNYWLNSILFASPQEQRLFLQETNSKKIRARPAWHLLCDLPMYNECFRTDLSVSRYIQERLVCLPSSSPK